MANSADEHGVAVGEKAILHFHGLGIRLKHPFPARQRRDEHQQRGFRQMEVGDQAIKDMKPVSRPDKTVDPTLMRR